MWATGEARHRFCRGLSVVVEAWYKEGGDENSRLFREEFALHSKGTGDVRRLVAMKQQGGRFSSNTFMVYVMAK